MKKISSILVQGGDSLRPSQPVRVDPAVKNMPTLLSPYSQVLLPARPALLAPTQTLVRGCSQFAVGWAVLVLVLCCAVLCCAVALLLLRLPLACRHYFAATAAAACA